MKRKWFKRIMMAVGILIGVFLIIAAAFMLFLNRGLNETQAMTIKPVTAARLADGTYDGQYGGGRFANQLAVNVKGGRITDIQVRKTVMFEKPEVTADLISRVIQAQKADVDIISGATATSKAYLKSIEDALDGQ